MDDRRFDQLTRMVGRGASRRAMLKALLGLGGAAATGTVISEEVKARQIGSRPIISPPPPPTTTTTTTTAAPCPAGQEQCPNSTLCCPEDTCARSGNQAICCDGTAGNGTVVCGLDCCDTDDQCCDGECCPDGAICLARRFPEGSSVEEETCCPVESICTGTGTFAGLGACCFGETPDCCNRENGEPTCINPETQCCTDEECPDIPQTCEAGVCLRGSQTCDTDFICGDDQHCCGAQGDEEAGTCVDADQCCTSVECDDDFANCQIGVCNREVFRCEAVSACELGSDCCAVNDSGACAPVEERTPCALEEGGTGICCTGECADTSLCVCTRNVECDPDRCENCLDGRCLSRCGVLLETLDTPVCDGAGTCVECLVDDDCFGGFCNPVTNTCFECRSNEDCFDCRICDVATGSCVADLEANGDPCFEFEEPDLACCFGDCLETCQACNSDADCPSCEICDFSSGNGQGHCQPCFFTNRGCCFDDFCVPEGVDCCQEDSDCPPPFCSDDFSSIVRYVCEPVSGSEGLCTEVVDQVCEGCASCLDSGAGASCVEGCQGSGVCCVTDRCQPLRTCPFSCIEDTDCPGDCAICQENGFCGTLEGCEPTTTTTTGAPTTTTAGCSALGESCGDPLPCCVGAGTCLSTGVCGPVAVGDVCPDSTPSNCVTGCCTNDICAGEVGYTGCSDTIPCCAGFCINGVCADGCSANDEPCNVPEHCCDGGPCVLGTCGCRDAGEACDVADDCCPSAGVCLSSQTCGKLENGAACPGAFACESGCCLNSVCAVPLGESGCSGAIPCCAGFCEGGICQENPPATIIAAPCVAGTCESLGGLCGQTIDDGCGTSIYCGDCPTIPAPMTCLTEGERCVSDSQCCAGLCRGRGCRDRGTKICQAGCTA